MSGSTPAAPAPAAPTPAALAVEVRLLQALLAAEHAVVYGYGVLGARLEDALRPVARQVSDHHRARRDALTALLLDRNAPAPPALMAYDVTVARQIDALALAVRLEEGMAGHWRDLVGGSGELRLRLLGAAGLSEVAVRAARWRLLLGRRPATVALPGQD